MDIVREKIVAPLKISDRRILRGGDADSESRRADMTLSQSKDIKSHGIFKLTEKNVLSTNTIPNKLPLNVCTLGECPQDWNVVRRYAPPP